MIRSRMMTTKAVPTFLWTKRGSLSLLSSTSSCLGIGGGHRLHDLAVVVPNKAAFSSLPSSRLAQAAYNSQQQEAKTSSSPSSWGWYGLAAVVALTTALRVQDSVGKTRCDDDDDDDSVEVDPYDNLPEKDEPTHCSICLTYRQGPCRPYRRKVEACTKDNEVPDKKDDDDENAKDDDDDDNDDDNDNDNAEGRPDPPCFKYMMPWIDCASGYRNLYALIELDTNYTEGIADLESSASKHLCWAPQHEPVVDWTPWQEYVQILNPNWTLPSIPKKKKSMKKRKNTRKGSEERRGGTTTSSSSSSSSPAATIALWKTLDQSSDPELVEVEATVPSQLDMGVLECAYALDQDDNVIGFAYGTKPSDAAAVAASKGETQTAKTSLSKESGNSDSDVEDDDKVKLTIRLLPERTRHIVIAAAYTHVENGGGGGGDDDAIETYLYKSRPFMLDAAAAAEAEEEEQ